jgi:hypothetical protein
VSSNSAEFPTNFKHILNKYTEENYFLLVTNLISRYRIICVYGIAGEWGVPGDNFAGMVT